MVTDGRDVLRLFDSSVTSEQWNTWISGCEEEALTTYQEYHGEGPLTDSGTCTYMGLPCEAILNFDYHSYPGSGGWGDSSPWEVCATNVYGYYDGKSCDNMADSGILAGVACSLTCAKMPFSPYWQYHRECMGALAVEEQCTNCGADTFSTVIGATSSTTCVTCPAFSTSSPSQTSCLCNAGYTGDSTTCALCVAGTYKNAAGSASCVVCATGKYGITQAAVSSGVLGHHKYMRYEYM